MVNKHTAAHPKQAIEQAKKLSSPPSKSNRVALRNTAVPKFTSVRKELRAATSLERKELCLGALCIFRLDWQFKWQQTHGHDLAIAHSSNTHTQANQKQTSTLNCFRNSFFHLILLYVQRADLLLEIRCQTLNSLLQRPDLQSHCFVIPGNFLK